MEFTKFSDNGMFERVEFLFWHGCSRIFVELLLGKKVASLSVYICNWMSTGHEDKKDIR